MASCDVETSNEMAEIAVLDATQSPLLRLPGELRNKIFEFAVGGHIIIVKNVKHSASPFEKTEDANYKTDRAEAEDPFSVDEKADDMEEVPITASERVSQIFTISLVCRQIYAETTLLQYTKNCFLFNSGLALRAFTGKLNWEQRNAVTTISIDEEYVLEKIVMRIPSVLGFIKPTPSFRRMFPALKNICFAPEHLLLFKGETAAKRLAAVVRALDLGGEDDFGLGFWCFNILDATSGVKKSWGIKFTSAVEAGEKSGTERTN